MKTAYMSCYAIACVILIGGLGHLIGNPTLAFLAGIPLGAISVYGGMELRYHLDRIEREKHRQQG